MRPSTMPRRCCRRSHSSARPTCRRSFAKRSIRRNRGSMPAHDHDRATVRRVLALGRCALFHGVSPADLAILAENAVETEIPAGTSLVAAGQRVSAVHVIVEGGIASAGRRWEAHEAFGAMEVFAVRTIAAAATTTHTTRSLQLDAEDLTEILEDNIGVLHATLRSVALSTREPIVVLVLLLFVFV